MSPDTPDVTPSNLPADAPAPAEAAEAPAPKRARAPRKTAAKTAAAPAGDDASPAMAAPAAPAAPDGAAAPASADGDAAAAPVPRKRTRKAAAPAADSAATDARADAAPVVAEAPARIAGTAPEEVAPAPVAPTHVAVGPVEADADGEADRDGGDAEGGEAGDEGEGRSRRSRRRRRGRRGAAEDGALDAAAAPEGAAEGAGAEGAATAPADGAARPPRPERPERLRGPAVEFATDAGATFASVQSGDFDIDAQVVEGEPSIPAKRVLAPEPDAPKLHKVLAQSGIGSRRDMEQLITDGKVTVNGEVAHTGQRISFGDEVKVAGRVVKLRIAPPPARVIAYHKPAGEVVTMDDPEKRPTVFRRLPRLAHGKWQSVGRLDINTEGLLLFTNSGDLANKLMHPRFGVEREYAARVLGTLDQESRDKLLAGVVIDGQPAQFKSIEDGGGEGVNRWYRVVITEGRNREVRKLFDAVGMAVSRLIRIRYGSVVLPKGLKRGVWVDLDENDVRRLRTLAGADEPQAVPPEARAPQNGGPPPRAERGDRPERGPRPQGGGQPSQPAAKKSRDKRGRERDRNDRSDRGGAHTPAPFREPGDPTSIPNPLMQTFDRRAIQQRERPIVADDFDEDGPIGPIPNPLQQTYDKRGIQGNRSPFAGKKGKGGGGGGGGNGPKQPDPMQTAVGYIGADAFVKKMHSRGGGGGRGRR